jgi:hypothetical protein
MLASQPWIEPLNRRTQALDKHNLGVCLASKRAVFAECFREGMGRLVAKLRKKANARLFDEGRFGEVMHRPHPNVFQRIGVRGPLRHLADRVK